MIPLFNIHQYLYIVKAVTVGTDVRHNPGRDCV